MHVFECVCMQKFRDEIILRGGGECKTRENLKFKIFQIKRGKTVVYWNSSKKSWDFSRSRMTKRIESLESSCEN